MKRVELNPEWPPLWKNLHAKDTDEVWEPSGRRGPRLGYRNRFKKLVNLAERYIPSGGRVLDVAAAQGNHTLALSEKGYHMVWNDIRHEIAGYVELKHEHGAIEFKPGNIFDFDHGEYDAIIIGEIIEHVAHPDQFLKKVSDLVKPGGHVLMTTPNGAFFRNRLPKWSTFEDPTVFEGDQFQPDGDGHIFLLYPEEVVEIGKSCNLNLEEIILFNSAITMGCYRSDTLTHLVPDRAVLWSDDMLALLPGKIRNSIMYHIAAVWRRQ